MKNATELLIIYRIGETIGLTLLIACIYCSLNYLTNKLRDINFF